MKENKNISSSSVPPPPQNPTSDTDETPQSFSSFFSGDWLDNVVFEPPWPPRIESSFVPEIRENNNNNNNNNNVNQNSLIIDNSNEEWIENNMLDLLLQDYNTTPREVVTGQCYSYNSSSSIHSTVHDLSASNGYTGLLSDVVNFDAKKRKHVASPTSELPPPPPPPLPCNGYTGLLSDVVNFDVKKRNHVASSTSEPPPPPPPPLPCNGYTGLLSDVVNFDVKKRKHVASPTNELPPPLPCNGYTGLLSDVVNFDVKKRKYVASPRKKLPQPPRRPSNGVVPTPTNGGASTSGIKKNAWSKEEHKLFLVGMHIYGQSDWLNVADNVVITKTHIQVASHAQKYFLRQEQKGQRRRRSSIHDTTTVDPELLLQVRGRLFIPEDQ